MMSCQPFIRFAALVAATAGCTSLADVGVTYEECVPVKGARYADEFTGTYQDLLDRCWRSDPAPEKGTAAFTADGDLVIRPVLGARWSPTTQAPILYRRMGGDFLVATRIEPVATLKGHHCLTHDEGAGLVVRRPEPQPFAWTTLLVAPYFAGVTKFDEACKDEKTHPPSARVQTNSFGLDEPMPKSKDNVGTDGEAYVAMCRQGSQLAYYYKLAEPPPPNQPAWIQILREKIGDGPLDVGLTVTAAPPRTLASDDSGIEGHFAWAVFVDYSSVPAVDGCEGAFSELVTPEGP